MCTPRGSARRSMPVYEWQWAPTSALSRRLRCSRWGCGFATGPPWQTLVAATRNAAAVCDVGDQLGTVEVGKIADLIVVAANPLEDIINVRRLQLVLKEGRVVSDKRHLSGAVLQPEEARS
jgi:cytosine/adenosine deaminase-related metal-dependent hydrolase